MDGRIAPRWRQGTVALCLGLAGLAQAEPGRAVSVAEIQVAQLTVDDGLGRLPVLRSAPRTTTPPAATKASVVNTETEPLLILAAGIAGLGWLRHLAKVRRAS